ncbi:LacI family DNA-binding transcriptional regulator [Phytobacter diazotrophicus]|uniref:LacI family DNA-binding transcriptional regulator n=1 Tax=Phytobacter diazotrophicus TaxID=395631 RepID=UPI0013EA4C34|nr:LacI family DNA-binding transcriptional regulator [Phytobacter diazotrophicus]MDU4356357.1 LacI family DNA-binding transcriptional regulator [Phytobacter diazotrophicus]MDU7134156.1 LacI family DNA-binding transcriptional regulator [Enterobacteriaceae bacterium]QIH61762.1 transcriptional regulator [Enterobacteriaceae bacterium A-F18]QJF16063.1 LacI family transcriptional regulator [Phytobacter diazotrophicus]
MVTILDVARMAGVSKATVSRALNGKVFVREEVKARILQAVADTGYRPNQLARNLANNKTNSIGLVITNGLYNGPFFSSMVYQAATRSEGHSRQLVLADGKHSAQDERDAIGLLLELRCEAIMIYPKYLSVSELDDIIDGNQTPIVVINRELIRNRNRCVFTDHRRSSEEMVEHLLAQGHTRIAFVAGVCGSPTGERRLRGYRDALRKAGISPDPQLMVRGAWSTESGYEAGRQLLALNIPFTCVLAANDDMAIGLAKAFQDAGKSVPGEISLAGFDDSVIGKYYTPSLTTIHVPMDEMIRDAVEILLHPDEKTVFSHQGTLVSRDSVARRVDAE